MSAAACVIVGASGMLGRELLRVFQGYGVQGLAGRADLDITDERAVAQILGRLRPTLVINAAAYNDVDGAETEPEQADAVNRAGPAHLAAACREIGAKLVHYSTDYVFDGRARSAYAVGDEPHPLGAYGRSKLAGERAVAGSGCRHLIIRTSWLFAAHGRNFVRSMLDLALDRPALSVVDDQIGRPTYAPDLARMTRLLLEKRAEGIYHASNEGCATRFELARAAVKLAGLPCDVRRCRTDAQPRPARRPACAVLDLARTAALIGPPRHWHVALADCMQRLTAVPLAQAS